MPPSTGTSNNNNGHANHSMSSTEDGSLKAVTIEASSSTSKPTEQAKKLNLQTGDLTDSSTNTSASSSATPSKEQVVPLGLEEEGSIDVFSSKSREFPEKEAPKKSLLGGVTLALMSALSFSITTVIVKYASDIKPSQMALFRYLGVLIFSIPVVNESQASWFGEPNWHWRTFMLVRALSGCTSLFFRYSALAYIGLAETTIIMLALPVMVFIIARIFLGEEFGRYHVLALVLSIVGIAFASNVDIVGLFFSKKDVQNHATVNSTSTWIPEQSSTTKSLYDNVTTSNSSKMTAKTDAEMMSSSTKNLIGSLFAIAAMVVGSLAYIMMRMMRTTHPSVILFNFALISLVEMTIINLAFYDFHLPSTGYSAYLVSILGILSFYGQLLLTKASQLEEAGVVSVVRSSGEAFFAFILQIVCFGEVPDLFTTLGAILVLASVCLLSFRKYIISLPDGSSLKMKFSFLTA